MDEDESNDRNILAINTGTNDKESKGVSSKTNLLLTAIISSLQRKSSPFNIRNLIILSSKLDGRDKITKALQYSARLIAWYYESRHYPSSFSEPYRSIQSNFTLSRKAFRLGKFVNEYIVLQDIIMKVDGAEFNSILLRVLKTMGLAGFWIGDNTAFLAKSKFINCDYNKALSFGTRCYFFSSCVGLKLALSQFRSSLSRLIHLKRNHIADEKTKDTQQKLSDFDLKYNSEIIEAQSKVFMAFLSIVKVNICFTGTITINQFII